MLPSRHLISALLLVPATMFGTGCGKRDEAPRTSSPDSQPTSRTTLGEPVMRCDWGQVTVEPDPGWDAAHVARSAITEIETAGSVLRDRSEGSRVEPRLELDVRYVVHSERLAELLRAIPASKRVMRWDHVAFFEPASRRLVFCRDADVRERIYLVSLALLTVQAEVPPIWFLDSLASWHAGLVLNRLRGDPLWRRGRAWRELVPLTKFEEQSEKQLEGICRWGMKQLPYEANLSWDAPIVVDFDELHLDPIVRLRALSWFLIFFIETYESADDQRVIFDGVPKYRALRDELGLNGKPDTRNALCSALRSRPEILRDFHAYQRFVNRKLNLGHQRSGIILGWNEYRNAKGLASGKPEDDLLR